MSIVPDAIRAYEQELLQKAEVLALGLGGLRAKSPERAVELLEAIMEKLEAAAIPGGGVRSAAEERQPEAARRMTPVVVSTRGGGADEIEDFLMDILAENPTGLSVQDIVNDLAEAQLDIRRQTLVVRLHRMVRAGKLSSLAHGHYILSEAERGRRRA
jgi:glycosyltransferase involved in cell wall biosynthesis